MTLDFLISEPHVVNSQSLIKYSPLLSQRLKSLVLPISYLSSSLSLVYIIAHLSTRLGSFLMNWTEVMACPHLSLSGDWLVSQLIENKP